MKLTCALFASLLLAPLGTIFAAEAARPNVVFIFADDWGWGDLSSHGHPWLKTPHLDRLAQEGTDFHPFNVLNPVCSPSRAAEMTGHVPLALRHSPTLRRACAKSRAQRCDQEFDVAEAPPEFERPLGPPTGKAQREGYIYTRDFRQASVWLDVKNEQARITWH